MVTPAVAPYVPSYANRLAYVSVEEFLNAPTGVDTSALKPSGSFGDNKAVLAMMLDRASGWVDAICVQVLAATSDTQVGMYRMRRDGTVWVPCDYSPVIAVTAVQWGWSPAQLTALTDLTGLWIQRKVVQVPIVGSIPATRIPSAGGSRVYVRVDYANGFANTALTAPTTAGASSVTVASAIGVAAGLPFTIYDGAATEDVVVAANYVYGANPVVLASATVNDHTAGAVLSALPPAVKQATISLACALIKTRGSTSVAMASIRQTPSTKELTQSGGSADVDVAKELLGEFIRVR